MEEDLYRLDDPATTISRSNGFNVIAVTSDFHTSTTPIDHLVLQFDHQAADHRTDMPDLIKTQIANHPRYPNLVSAYIECRKVGAPPELASFLEEIGRENHRLTGRNEIGADPELDDFMETYCEVLHRFKEELSKPLDEATMFLSNMESELSHLCQGALTRTLDYRSDEDLSSDEVEASESSDHDPSQEDIKGMLIRKYSGCLSNLRNEFLKKRKKGKLPKDARMTLLHWWNNHYRWPYPTEEEKLELSEITGLDQKQINNWFINQRKRHWKPTEDVKFALTEAVAGNDNGEPT